MFAPWKSWRASRAVQQPAEPAPPEPPAAIYNVEGFWCDQHGMYMAGWLHCREKKVESLTLRVGEDRRAVKWHERPDVLTHYPEANVMCGFEIYLPCRPFIPPVFEVETADGIATMSIELPKRELTKQPPTSLYTDFIHRVNDEHLSILEIGGRTVGVMSVDNRQFFTGASRYVGMDIHPGPGVNIVGDVHELSSFIESESFDALYSSSVLEHVQIPWIAAAEMNRVLKPGGIMFHSTVHSWPLHEMPNDFWRFSDEGLKVLFGPMSGFEVLGTELSCPLTMIPDYRDSALGQMPLYQSFAESSIVAKKVGPPVDARDILAGRAKQYPKRA